MRHKTGTRDLVLWHSKGPWKDVESRGWHTCTPSCRAVGLGLWVAPCCRLTDTGRCPQREGAPRFLTGDSSLNTVTRMVACQRSHSLCCISESPPARLILPHASPPENVPFFEPCQSKFWQVLSPSFKSFDCSIRRTHSTTWCPLYFGPETPWLLKHVLSS